MSLFHCVFIEQLRLVFRRNPKKTTTGGCCGGLFRKKKKQKFPSLSDLDPDIIETDVKLLDLLTLDIPNLTQSTMYVFGKSKKYLMTRGNVALFGKDGTTEDGVIELKNHHSQNLCDYFMEVLAFVIDGNIYKHNVIYRERKFNIHALPIFNNACDVIGGIMIIKPFRIEDASVRINTSGRMTPIQ